MNTISTVQLSTLDNLFLSKENEVKDTIANLTVNEVKEDARFTATVQRIKDQTKLTPVVIGEPKITDNNTITRNVAPNFQDMWGGQRKFEVVTVEFPFTGSEELFNFRASGIALTMGSVYLPSYNTISIDVQLQQLNKDVALNSANSEIALTKELIKQNNPFAEQWNNKINATIDTLAEQRRKQLLELYS
jgi:hypothetical protein